MLRRVSRKVWLGFAIVGFLNCALFLAGTLFVGGDALNGKAENGRYFVWGYNTHDHIKEFTEVRRSVYLYSVWHGISVAVTWPLVILAGFAVGGDTLKRK